VNIVVCLKQILDPEIPVRDFRIDGERKEAQRGSAGWVTNIFCENALETALQVRERVGGRITVLIYAPGEGPESGEPALRKALAMKADAAVWVVNDGHRHPDPLAVAQVLAAAIRQLGETELVLVGRESGDWGVGQTGGLLAEELGLPGLSFVDRIEPGEVAGGVLLRRQTDRGWERVEAQLPLVLTITNDDQNLPRIPKTRDIMLSSRQPILRWTLEELPTLPVPPEEIRSGGSYYEVVDLAIPTREVDCQMVAGETLEEKVDQLAERILEVVRTS
jgi:electron transfer flavoprotein beta subunit